jgi:hypothetical protein
MAPKTRSKPATAKSAADALAATSSTTQKAPLRPESTNPPKLFILPKETSPDARIVSLSHPRANSSNRYLCCPQKGFYEFTRVAAPKTTPRSWLISPSETSPKPAIDNSQTDGGDDDFKASKGYVTKSADIFIATPIDPIFLVLPALAPPSKSADPPKRLFLTSEDYFDTLITTSPHFQPLLRQESTRALLESRMATICDTVDAGDESMYRLSEAKLLAELLAKAEKMVAHGLPASMEEKLVRKSLEAPLMNLKRGESSMHELAEDEEDSQATTPGLDSQTTADSTETAATSVAEGAVEAPIKSTVALISAPEGIPHLQRLRVALDFIFASYLSTHLNSTLNALLGSGSSCSPSSPPAIDFAPLTAHLAHLASLRTQAMQSRSLSDFSRKRAFNDEDAFDAESRAEKKRKKEEEEKRIKAGQSRGVRDLKKVNVSGMKKMSDFFKKKA